VTFHRVAGAARHLWASVPLIGFVALFAGIGYGVFQSYHARQLAATAAQFGKDNKALIEQVKTQDAATIKAKDDVIAEKDRQLTEKDAALTGQTSIIGQIYNAATALQQQVIALGGKPKTIPVTLPGRGTTLVPSPGGAASAPVSTVRPPVAPSPSPSMSPAISLVVPCLVICPPTH
jgi:hypothetical protein